MAKMEAYGAAFEIGDGGDPSEAFTAVAQVRTISGPSMSAETIDVSTHDGAGYREFVASLLDGGEVTLDIVWDPVAATHTAMHDDLEARALRNVRIVWPDAGTTTWAFAGQFTGLSPNAPVDGELSASVTFKLSGAITIS